MPELLLELFSEEIPARFQRRAAEDLKKAVTDGIVARGLIYEGARAFVTPRRLALSISGIPGRSPDISEERKGPKVGAPQPAIDGFLRATGLASIEAATVRSDPRKGDYYVARIERKGETAEAVLTELLPAVISGFPWPKSMRWGGGRAQWVRPLRAITATFGSENEEPMVLPFSIDGLAAGHTTYGHRFLAPGPLTVRRLEDYLMGLERAKVVLDPDRRKEIIRTDAENLAFAQGLSLIMDEGLLEEVAGLVEWPVPMLGRFDEAFLDVPEEVVILTIRANQKCFCLRRPDGKLANHFILTANTIPSDDGATIVAGNERVIRARLSDAKFFYDSDLATPLEAGLPKLADVVFHQKLGTQAERVERLEQLSAEIAPLVGADAGMARRAARLAKADLVTGMVGEFPELQGLMGRYYAIAQGEAPSVATAIEDHYRPLGPGDRVPADPVAISVALADKLDLLTGFWAIDEKPTGSRDPFALRRAALGVIRIILENGLKLRLSELFASGRIGHKANIPIEGGSAAEAARTAIDQVYLSDLLAFFHDRLKVSLRESGARYDLVDAVLTPGADDLFDITRRVEALSEFLASEDGQNLLTGYRRAANILADEEKKDARAYGGPVEMAGDPIAADYHLWIAVEGARGEVADRVGEADYKAAMQALATLRRPVDNFFEAVMVNADDARVRENRLNLLANLRDVMHLVADFSKVVG